jgi:hypothetical protein
MQYGIMRNDESRVIGFFAYRARAEVICVEKDACLIAGSEAAMEKYIHDLTGMPTERFTIRKTRLGEILEGVTAGAAYAFDKEAYSRFFPLARAAGLPVRDADFEMARSEGRQFFTVRDVPRAR